MPEDTKDCGFLKQNERVCCTDEPPKGSYKPDCLETWKEERKKVGNKLVGVSATTKKAENSYDNAFFWEAILKGWIDDAGKAQEQVQIVLTVLERFVEAICRMDRDLGITAREMKALLCLVKDIFDDLRLILFVASSTDEERGRLEKLKEHIKCSGDLDEAKKKDALACIAPYETKVTAIYNDQEAVLKKLLEILKAEELLALLIGAPRIHSDDPDKQAFGLKWQIEDLLKRMKGETSAKKKTDACICGHEPAEDEPTVEPPCGNDILKPPQTFLPIKGPADKPGQQPSPPGKYSETPPAKYSDYYAKLERLYKDAMAKTASLLAERNKARAVQDEVTARRDSLDAAIAAAENAAKK